MQTLKRHQAVHATPRPGVIATSTWAPEFIADVRSRVPYRLCAVCGESIGAARLAWHPGATTCAWCADERLASPQPRPAARA